MEVEELLKDIKEKGIRATRKQHNGLVEKEGEFKLCKRELSEKLKTLSNELVYKPYVSQA
jgi:hypothetical protein